MNCPPDVAEILLSILDLGILQARAFGWSGEADRAAAEADHVHNLPTLIWDYSPGRLEYYWTAEQPSYLARATPEQAAAFAPLWDRLRPHVERLCAPPAR